MDTPKSRLSFIVLPRSLWQSRQRSKTRRELSPENPHRNHYIDFALKFESDLVTPEYFSNFLLKGIVPSKETLRARKRTAEAVIQKARAMANSNGWKSASFPKENGPSIPDLQDRRAELVAAGVNMEGGFKVEALSLSLSLLFHSFIVKSINFRKYLKYSMGIESDTRIISLTPRIESRRK